MSVFELFVEGRTRQYRSMWVFELFVLRVGLDSIVRYSKLFVEHTVRVFELFVLRVGLDSIVRYSKLFVEHTVWVFEHFVEGGTGQCCSILETLRETHGVGLRTLR